MKEYDTTPTDEQIAYSKLVEDYYNDKITTEEFQRLTSPEAGEEYVPPDINTAKLPEQDVHGPWSKSVFGYQGNAHLGHRYHSEKVNERP